MAVSHPGLELAPSHKTDWCQPLSMYSGQVWQQESGEGMEFNFLSLVLSSLGSKSDGESKTSHSTGDLRVARRGGVSVTAVTMWGCGHLI